MTGIPGLKVESQALLDFAKEVSEDVGAQAKAAGTAFEKLPMKVGLSGLPSAATLGNWHLSLLTATSNFLMDFGEGSAAVSTGATSVAAIYQSSDASASERMNQVNATFAPGPNDPSLSKDRAAAAKKAQEEGKKTDAEIQQQARTTVLTSATKPTAAAPLPTNVCKAPDPYDSTDAGNLVTNHRKMDQNDHHSEMSEYEAPSDTPQGLTVPGAPKQPSASPGPSPTPRSTTTTAPTTSTAPTSSTPRPSPGLAPTAPTTTTTTPTSTSTSAPTSAPTSGTSTPTATSTKSPSSKPSTSPTPQP